MKDRYLTKINMVMLSVHMKLILIVCLASYLYKVNIKLFFTLSITVFFFLEMGYPNLRVVLIRALKTGVKQPLYLHQGTACLFFLWRANLVNFWAYFEFNHLTVALAFNFSLFQFGHLMSVRQAPQWASLTVFSRLHFFESWRFHIY